VRRYALDPVEAVRIVAAAGGVCVLAHPFASTRGWSVPESLIAELAATGLGGVEVAHPDHDEYQRRRLAGLAAEYGLIATGGSDDHGELTGDRIGVESTDTDQFERLLSAATGVSVITRTDE
jgi:predicted metal-dependent phosphoesterase TrpH